MTFKVGDKVRCIDNIARRHITVGKIYQVTGRDGNCISIINDEGNENFYLYGKFELVQEDKLPHELLGLPKYFVVKKDESDPLWGEFWEWNVEQCGFSTRDAVFNYYGRDDRKDDDGSQLTNGFDFFDSLESFKNNPTLITLAERDRCVNKKTSQTKKLSKPIRSCEHNGSIYKEDTIDGVSIEDMKATRDNINSKLHTHRNLFNKKK